MPRRFNNCEFNFPCPIFCPTIGGDCTNEVVNPVLSGEFGFFNNTAVGTVASGSTIALSQVLDGGIVGSDGSITLSGGNYSVSYFVQGTIPTSGTMSVALELGGTQVSGSEISTTQTAGQVATLSQTIAVSTTSGATLSLVNTSADSVDFSLASILVTRL